MVEQGLPDGCDCRFLQVVPQIDPPDLRAYTRRD